MEVNDTHNESSEPTRESTEALRGKLLVRRPDSRVTNDRSWPFSDVQIYVPGITAEGRPVEMAAEHVRPGGSIRGFQLNVLLRSFLPFSACKNDVLPG